MEFFSKSLSVVIVAFLLASFTAAAGENNQESKMEDILGRHLVNARRQRVATDTVKGKTIGLYFSAQWCPPCRVFTPVLVEAYQEMKKEGKALEIVFISHDRSSRDMLKYMTDYKMPWLAVPFDGDRRQNLAQKYGVRGIPALIIIDDTGKVISRNGREEISRHGVKAFDSWQDE